MYFNIYFFVFSPIYWNNFILGQRTPVPTIILYKCCGLQTGQSRTPVPTIILYKGCGLQTGQSRTPVPTIYII